MPDTYPKTTDQTQSNHYGENLVTDDIDDTPKTEDACLTMSIPEAGRKFFGLGRNGSYTAVKLGLIPTVKAGKRLRRVPVRVMERRMKAGE